MGEKLLAPPCQGILITLPQCQYSDDRALSCFYCQKSCLKVPLLSFVGFPVLLVLHDYFHTCEMSEKLEPSAVQGNYLQLWKMVLMKCLKLLAYIPLSPPSSALLCNTLPLWQRFGMTSKVEQLSQLHADAVSCLSHYFLARVAPAN